MNLKGMNLWCDVFAPADITKPIGAGRVQLVSARFSRELDRVGSVALRTAFGDNRAQILFAQKNRFSIYGQTPGGNLRMLGMGIIESADYDEATGAIDIKGPDILKELVDKNVWTNKKYEAKTIAYIVADLVGLVSGWTTNITGATETIDIRFDGVSVFKALQILAKENGYHVRLGEGRVLEFGAFGDSLDLRAVKPAFNATQIAARAGMAVIEQPKVRYKSDGLINRILVLGAGEGEAALTLEDSNRVSPYTIQTTTDSDSKDIYYLEHAASIALYGAIERVFKQREITPLAHNSSALEVASNAVYDAAAAYLDRNALPIEVYNFVLRGVNETIKPAQKIWLEYRGYAYDEDKEKQVAINLDAEYWAVNITDNYDGNGLKTQSELSNVDQQLKRDEDVIISTFEEVSLDNLYIKPFPFWTENTYLDSIQTTATTPAGKSAFFKIEIDESVRKVIEVRLRIKTRPPYSLTGAPLITTTLGAVSTNPVQHFHPMPADDPFFRIIEGVVYPDDFSIKINGVDKTIALGGPWGNNNSAIDEELDITDILIADGIQQDHTIEFFTSTSRSGEVGVINSVTGQSNLGFIECNVRIRGVTQALGV